MAFDFWEDVLCPLGRAVEGVGYGIDRAVTTAIDATGVIDQAIDYAKENPGKSAIVVGAAVVTGGMALAAAPAIGAVVSAAGFGVGGGTLSGAAASSAGLAALGAGSLASGGLGMAGGTVVVTATGGVLGGTAAGGIAKAIDSD